MSETGPSLGPPRPGGAARVYRDGMFRPAGDVYGFVKEMAVGAVGVHINRCTTRQARPWGSGRRVGAVVVGVYMNRFTRRQETGAGGVGGGWNRRQGRDAVKEAFLNMLRVIRLMFFFFPVDNNSGSRGLGSGDDQIWEVE